MAIMNGMKGKRDGMSQLRGGGSFLMGLVFAVAVGATAGCSADVGDESLGSDESETVSEVAPVDVQALSQSLVPGGSVQVAASAGNCTLLRVKGRDVPPKNFICDYSFTTPPYDGRLHVFLIGTDHAVWHTWDTKAGGGGPMAAWASLGGNARSGVSAFIEDSGRALRIRVLGTDSRNWCRTYNSPSSRGAWTGWAHC
jgi:hypothetical protein